MKDHDSGESQYFNKAKRRWKASINEGTGQRPDHEHLTCHTKEIALHSKVTGHQLFACF